MLSFGFGKRPKHKKFAYIPRFYDEDKERLEERLSQHKGDINDKDKVKARISSGLRQGYVGDQSYRQANVKKSNLRILYIFVFLIFISYLIVTSDRIQLILESFS